MEQGNNGIPISLFETEVSLPTAATPGQVHVFSIGTRGGSYNNAGISDDTQPTFANYDGVRTSYSLQELQNAGLTAG